MEVLRIAVCDDEEAQAALYASMARGWAQRAGLRAEVCTYGSAESLLFAWPDHSADILLADIQMPGGEDGLSLARRLRAQDTRLVIIFITGFSDYAEAGYDVEALHYLKKPVHEDRLHACLDRAYKRLRTAKKTLLLSCADTIVRLPEEDLLYAEAFSHSTAIYTLSDPLETRMNLSALERMLSQDAFFRPHRSYLVNLRHVERIGREDALLTGGVSVPVSRRRWDAFNKAFITYWRREVTE